MSDQAINGEVLPPQRPYSQIDFYNRVIELCCDEQTVTGIDWEAIMSDMLANGMSAVMAKEDTGALFAGIMAKAQTQAAQMMQRREDREQQQADVIRKINERR